jgi:hypothetical protein
MQIFISGLLSQYEAQLAYGRGMFQARQAGLSARPMFRSNAPSGGSCRRSHGVDAAFPEGQIEIVGLDKPAGWFQSNRQWRRVLSAIRCRRRTA